MLAAERLAKKLEKVFFRRACINFNHFSGLVPTEQSAIAV